MVSHWSREGDRILEAWYYQARRWGSSGFQGGLRKVVLESWYYTRRVVQRYSRSSRHNSRELPTGCLLGTNSPEGSRGGPGGLVLHQTLVWKWSWRPGVTPGRLEREWSTCGNWIPGNSRLRSSVQIPQNMATTGSIPTAARGVDIQRALSSIPG